MDERWARASSGIADCADATSSVFPRSFTLCHSSRYSCLSFINNTRRYATASNAAISRGLTFVRIPACALLERAWQCCGCQQPGQRNLNAFFFWTIRPSPAPAVHCQQRCTITEPIITVHKCAMGTPLAGCLRATSTSRTSSDCDDTSILGRVCTLTHHPDAFSRRKGDWSSRCCARVWNGSGRLAG